MTDPLKDAVKDKYGQVARGSLSNQNETVKDIATSFGYTELQLASIPADANMALSCGNPTAMASLKPGEVVVDLGCGGGLDVFLAAKAVGDTGRVIGIDMTQDMIDRAKRNAAESGVTNVEFHLAEIENLPLDDDSTDCILSNCVLNLVPDKDRAFAETFRILKPGGRLAVSDIALKQALPEDLRSDIEAYVGCIAGAIGIDDYVNGLRRAGFVDVKVEDTGADLNAYGKLTGEGGSSASCCCGGTDDAGSCEPHASPAQSTVLSKYNVNDYAASVRVTAIKPAGTP